MTQSEIKQEKDRLCDKIRRAEERLNELKVQCSHPHTFEGNYSWRIGVIQKANICSDCGSLVNYID